MRTPRSLVRLLSLALGATLFAAQAKAQVIDYGPPADALGHWEFDLYDATGAQRGTATNPFYFNDQVDQTATGTVSVLDTGSTSSTGNLGQTIIAGTPTANSFVNVSAQSFETAMIQVTGNWTGTLQVETSSDNGVTWVSHAIHQVGSPNFFATTTGNTVGSLNMAAKTNLRIRAIAAMTGTANVSVRLSTNPSSIYVANALKLTDGSVAWSTTTATIKAANVSPTAADTALVVGSAQLPASVGQKTSAQSLPVVVASDQIVVTVGKNSSKPIQGNGTTVIKTGAGKLHMVVVGANYTNGIITLYDNTAGSGTVLLALQAGTPSGGLLSSSGDPGPVSIGPVDIDFTTGLTAVTTGSTANYFTVIYY